VDVDSMLLLLSAGIFKLGLYAFWKIHKRLTLLECKTRSIKKAIISLHKEEFKELSDALHRINTTLVENNGKDPAIELVDREAVQMQQDIWIKEDSERTL